MTEAVGLTNDTKAGLDIPSGNAVAGPRPDLSIIFSMKDMFVSVKAFFARSPAMKSSILTRSLHNEAIHQPLEPEQVTAYMYLQCAGIQNAQCICAQCVSFLGSELECCFAPRRQIH